MIKKSNDRELGEIGVRLGNLEKGQTNATAESKEHREQFDQRLETMKKSNDTFQQEVREYIHEARGAWRATTIIATVAATTVAVVWKIGLWLLSIPIK